MLDKSTLPNMPIPGKSYTVLVPRTDVDGNDIAGVRHPNIEVPVATYTGWALRRAPFAEGEDCALTGQYIPFEATREERLDKGDPRLSLEERYKHHDQYVTQVARAADRLVRQRLLLDEDAMVIKTEAAESAIGK
jgi:Alpha/beta hydrolase domain